MNEAAKTAIAARLQDIGDTTVDFDFGTGIGKEAAAAAIQEFLFDNPEQVTNRPEIAAS